MPAADVRTATNKPFLSRASRLLGARGRMKLVRFTAKCLRRQETIGFPLDIAQVKRVAIFLPESPLEALHQIRTVMAVASLFKQAQVVIVCELHVAIFFEHLQGIHEIFTYDSADRYLYSRELASLAQMLGGQEYDLCLFLERSPDISLLHLMTQLSPRVRIGFDGASEYPFLNVRVRLSDTKSHVEDQNLVVARILGARPPSAGRWAVSKETVEELRHMLKECGISESARIAGLDAGHFFHAFGERWCDELVDGVSALSGLTWYLYSESVPDGDFRAWLVRRGLPVLSALSPSRSAALIQQSVAVVSGQAVLFELANLLAKPVVGVFPADEVCRYCRPTATCRGISFSTRPDQATVREIVGLIGSLG